LGMSETDQDRKARLDTLEAKLAARRKTAAPKRHQDETYSQAQLGWRMVTELVSGLGIGLAMGYGLDALFGTLPWLMIVFTLLGFAAGVRTMLRSAREIETQAPATSGGDKDGD